jgi:hypothetical protein
MKGRKQIKIIVASEAIDYLKTMHDEAAGALSGERPEFIDGVRHGLSAAAELLEHHLGHEALMYEVPQGGETTLN